MADDNAATAAPSSESADQGGHSGARAGTLPGRGRTVLTASDATQYSFEGNQPHGAATQSVFTRYLVAGLRDGSADLDGDGDITLDELYSYVHDRVVEEMPQQRPKKQDNVEGRMVIARNVHWTLPGYLRNAIASPISGDRLAALDGLTHLRRVGNDMVRSRAEQEIRRVADDDSKLVSAAATALLQPAAPPVEQPIEYSAEPLAKRPDTSAADVGTRPDVPLTAPPQPAEDGTEAAAAHDVTVVPVLALARPSAGGLSVPTRSAMVRGTAVALAVLVLVVSVVFLVNHAWDRTKAVPAIDHHGSP